MTQPSAPADPNQDHQEHEDQSWTINIPGHAQRSDSPEYVHSRQAMTDMAGQVSTLIYGQPPYEDHHGGGLWLKDDQGWFLVRNLAGLEWSSQFCADPAKVDLIRQNARRLYAAFPSAAQELGIQQLLTARNQEVKRVLTENAAATAARQQAAAENEQRLWGHHDGPGGSGR